MFWPYAPTGTGSLGDDKQCCLKAPKMFLHSIFLKNFPCKKGELSLGVFLAKVH